MQFHGRHILRWHAGFLLILTPLLTVASYVGVFTGVGPYGPLADNPLAISGLVQAYPLMGLVAVAMWIGAHGTTPRAFSLLAIAAHLVPLSTLALLWQPIMASPIAPAIPFSFLIHGGGIAAEIVGNIRGYGARRDRPA